MDFIKEPECAQNIFETTKNENKMNEGMVNVTEGNWTAPLSFPSSRQRLFNNKPQAAKRAMILHHSLTPNPAKTEHFFEFMTKFLDRQWSCDIGFATRTRAKMLVQNRLDEFLTLQQNTMRFLSMMFSCPSPIRQILFWESYYVSASHLSQLLLISNACSTVFMSVKVTDTIYDSFRTRIMTSIIHFSTAE